MHDRIAPRVIFPLHERLTGHTYWTGFLRLRKLQWLTSGDLKDRAYQKLQPLLAHAYEHVPIYRRAFHEAGIEPGAIRSVEDLSLLPRVDKADLRRDFPEGVVADNLPKDRRRRGVTSGSTGIPFEFFTDLATMDVVRSSYLFFWDWAGIGPWVPGVRIAAPPHFYSSEGQPGTVGKILRRTLVGERLVSLDGAELDLPEFKDQVSRLRSNRPYFIWSYPSYGTRLALQLIEEGKGLARYPEVFVSYAETLTVGDRDLLEMAFRCKVVNHYGSLEIPFIAQTCPDNPDLFHVNSERAIVRVVDEDGHSAAPGDPGRVLVTDLFNYVMPLINYDIGDCAVAGKACSCGRGLPTLERVEGRVSEVIRKPGGGVVSPSALESFLLDVCCVAPYIWKYQVIQNRLDSICLNLVPTAIYGVEFATKLKEDLAGFLGPGMNVSIETVDGIDLQPSGKRLVIKSAVA